MKKWISYGMFMLGIVLCLYSPFCNLIEKYVRESDVQEYADSIGSITIAGIDVELPIFDGTDEEVLSQGIGHIAGSSPLGGGENTHSILAGHRGLPNAAMLLRLNELEEGDVFILYVSEQKLLYEVCEIQVIRPEETENLRVQEGKDLVSLVTCTPYGINTHRLVVTGERKVCDE